MIELYLSGHSCESRRWIAHATAFSFEHLTVRNVATGLTRRERKVIETPDKRAQADKKPEAVARGASNRLTATVVSLAALAILGAATANSLPNSDRFSLPHFDRIAMPNFDRLSLPKFDFSWPSFNRTPAPKTNRLAELAPPRTAPPPMPDPAVYAALTDIQFSQGQNGTALATLTERVTENSATQQADLKRISRQLMSLSAQVSALQSGMGPLTTGSITPSNPRARIIRTSRKATHSPPPLPKPVGPVSVGGAPLAAEPAPAPRSGV